MTYSLSRASRAVGLAAAVLGLVATGILVGASRSASAAGSAAPLDHFLCYQSREIGIKAPSGVFLKNQIQTAPFSPVFGAASTHCNPANKQVPTRAFIAKNPLAHLLCFTITYKAASATVLLTNQFGKATMVTSSPTSLCLPSWKSNVAPPNASPNAPAGLDHFTCYPVKALAASYGFHPPATKAEDEFSAPKYSPLRLGIANLLCVPTTKFVAGVVYQPQTPNDLSLVCFPTQPTPLWKLVYDQNQFGQGKIFPLANNEEFCLPSTAQVQGSPGA